ncbi:MAG: hypothetical protein JXA91_00660 [Candidatus Thermoplasmatota archaeon]|nr:hypothetical protein [Candidatus Thermoplasmatota archaeon]
MKIKLLLAVFLAIIILLCGCVNIVDPLPDRHSKIPADAVKMTPENDSFPPQLHSDEYEYPIPMSGPINTAGAEDSAFFPCCDNETLYFFFTPDVRVPVEEQLTDEVTGIYVTHKVDGEWEEPVRVLLQDRDKLALDGCPFILDDIMWFCTAREGYTGIHWFTAEYKNGKWTNWKESDFNPEFLVGELHFTADGTELYYHSNRSGGKGVRDIWMLKKVDGEWQGPINIEAVNSEEDESMPYITSDGEELWFNRKYLGTPAVYRSRKLNGSWQEPELIISQFAGEPTLDSNGNIYFVHHFYKDNEMIEADIYVAYKK